VFVAVFDGRPRVLARAGRDYRSRKKVRRAIGRLRNVFPRAKIRGKGRFHLPYAKFEIVPGVLPLRVQASQSGYVPFAAHGREFTAITPGRAQEAETPRAEPEEKPGAPVDTRAESVETQSAPERKPASAVRRRRTT
jgi:hypothetical protein